MTSNLIKATHAGVLSISDAQIPCVVLETGERVLTNDGFMSAIGRAKKGAFDATKASPGLVTKLPDFLAAENLKPFIDEALGLVTKPIKYLSKHGGGHKGVSYGYRAELLPAVCRVYLDARDAGVLRENQIHIARKCDLLVRGLATVGIIALVDEATGYQADRAKDALARILEAYISPTLREWVHTFPDEFFKQICRLNGWEYRKGIYPQVVGKWINDLVYSRLAPGVLKALLERNPDRQHRFHQYLTENIGTICLKEHLNTMIALMKSSPDWETFLIIFNRAKPALSQQLDLGLPVLPSEKAI